MNIINYQLNRIRFHVLWLAECILLAWGCQSVSYLLSDSLGAARVNIMCTLTAWGCQGAHIGLCDSLGWQGGDFAFSASFLILNEIMRHLSGVEPLDRVHAGGEEPHLLHLVLLPRLGGHHAAAPGRAQHTVHHLIEVGCLKS